MPSISGGNMPMTLRLSAVVSSWTGPKLPCRNGWCGHSDVPLSGAAKMGPALSPSTHRPPVRAKLLRKSRRFIMAPPCCIASVFVDAYSIYRAPVHGELPQDRIGGEVGRDFRYDESHRRELHTLTSYSFFRAEGTWLRDAVRAIEPCCQEMAPRVMRQDVPLLLGNL